MWISNYTQKYTQPGSNFSFSKSVTYKTFLYFNLYLSNTIDTEIQCPTLKYKQKIQVIHKSTN